MNIYDGLGNGEKGVPAIVELNSHNLGFFFFNLANWTWAY